MHNCCLLSGGFFCNLRLNEDAVAVATGGKRAFAFSWATSTLADHVPLDGP